MKASQMLIVAVAALGFASEAFAQRNFGNNDDDDDNQGGGTDVATGNGGNTTDTTGGDTGDDDGDNPLLLLEENVQDASNSPGGADGEAGQAASETDPANFINFCTGKTLTNGAQVTQGSCNGVVMGDIPSNNNMVSAIIVFPGPGDDIDADTTFDIQVQTTNLVAGSFTDPITTYYSAPQQLQGGNVVGHCHVTVQDLNNDIATTDPPDPKVFAFFKGINDDGNGQGLLTATVTDGLAAGTYRVCTMNSASNHQPVLMPVAQRGAQDDCQKFTVGQGTGNAGGDDGTGDATDTGDDATASTSATGATATDATGGTGDTDDDDDDNTGAGGGGFRGNRGRFGRGRGRGRFAARDWIA
ncbi:uncharacterized protein Z518_08113 [Rhinocladiella mackenziei CBS 650.93]|uniref:Ribosomal protein s17 n=1 Tax=Rhinocladiella mackenziei CBS 650.93 TaxID=1442369 RepID=A0A0D2I8I2_9EURO|nr:uncharacterized protein Z518_08113 [Rhinocladiella mackenziei CBS 650.93]KIX02174.1 hypothetical protein Z518_08113 [Rhinocladiella mackenziei CBS 650.93]